MKLFTVKQIQELDKATIKNEPIASIDLMERASQCLFDAFVERYVADDEVFIFAGSGNNGGDALALARMLSKLNSVFQINVFVLESEKRSADNKANLDRLKNDTSVEVKFISTENEIPEISSDAIVVDGLFGTGLNKPVSGIAAAIINQINESGAEVFSIDIPRGLYSENNAVVGEAVIKADVVVSFQFPKIAFLLSDSESYIGEWQIRDIGLHQDAMDAISSPYSFFTKDDVLKIYKKKSRFAHKGTCGHALLVAGKKNMMGAAVLAAKSALRSGVGLLTAHVPQYCGATLQNTVPEALLNEDRSELMFTDELDFENYSAVGVGPAIGTKPNAQKALLCLLQNCDKPLVMDADALNILSENKEWLRFLPENTIITPHPGEFDRLTQKHTSGYERLLSQIEFAQKWKIIVVLKGAYTSIAFPDGAVSFNSTGNYGMATAGSGDVLTGVILGLLAQGYSQIEASLLGVWWHGEAADIYAQKYLPETMIASDIVDYMRSVDM